MRENLVMTSAFTLSLRPSLQTGGERLSGHDFLSSSPKKLFLSLLLQKVLEMKGCSLEDFFSTTVIEL